MQADLLNIFWQRLAVCCDLGTPNGVSFENESETEPPYISLYFYASALVCATRPRRGCRDRAKTLVETRRKVVEDALFAIMHNVTSVELTRDCEATQIPAGTTTTLPAGTPVDITQTLGGSYTVHVMGGGLFRIAASDADALGLKAESQAAEPSPQAAGPVDEKAVWETLRTCYDPEIPVNIVDLGLVYDMKIAPLPSGSSAVAVKMTLTAPGCGMGGVIAGDAQQRLLALPGVEEANVEIVWDPPWHHSMITEAGRKILGLD
jgi:probable FeS assembly SUF system protein SufT